MDAAVKENSESRFRIPVGIVLLTYTKNTAEKVLNRYRDEHTPPDKDLDSSKYILPDAEKRLIVTILSSDYSLFCCHLADRDCRLFGNCKMSYVSSVIFRNCCFV